MVCILQFLLDEKKILILIKYMKNQVIGTGLPIKKAKKYFNVIINDEKIKTVIIGLTWHSLNLIDKDENKYSSFKKRDESLVYLIEKLKKK